LACAVTNLQIGIRSLTTMLNSLDGGHVGGFVQSMGKGKKPPLQAGKGCRADAAARPVISCISDPNRSNTTCLQRRCDDLSNFNSEEKSFSPLAWAALRGHAHVCQVLIKGGADLEALPSTPHRAYVD
jgi:ankyrin repeat protein